MILTKTPTEMTGNITFSKVIPMGIDAQSFGIILDSLIRIYSNPYVAALREYTSNAWDSHHNCNPTRPIEVSLPSGLSPVFVVEDFGVGMDRAGLADYGQFGFSTKREDNDNIGGYGLGSKVGLAFASQYTVRAVKDGYVNTVIIGRDEASNPQMGFLNGPDFPEDATEEERELIELAYPGEPTDLPNGVKITIPTMEYRKFQEALSSNFFLGFAPGTILIDGKAPTYSVHNPAQFEEIGNGLGWRRAKGAQHNVGGVALVHGVSYTVNWREIARDMGYSAHTGFLSEIIVEINNGDIEIQRSRESLVYSKTTTAVLNQKLKEVLSYATKQYQFDVANAPTYRDAVQLQRKATSFGFRAEYLWKGKAIKTHVSSGHPLASVPVTYSSVDYGGNSNSGLQASKTLYSFKTVVDYRHEQITRPITHSILVYGSKDPQEVRNRTLHVESNGSTAFAEYDSARLAAENEGHPEVKTPSVDAYEFSFTSLDKKKLPTWFKSMFARVMSADEFMETVTIVRKERAAEAAAVRKANAVPKAVQVGLPVRVVRLREGGRSDFSEITADQLDPTHKHVMIQIGASDLADQLISALMTIRGARNQQHVMFTYLEKHQNFTFLYATKSVKMDKYIKEVPNLIMAGDLPKMLESIAKGLVGQKSELQKRAILDRNRGDVDWAMRLSTEAIDTILNKETREWVVAVQEQGTVDDSFLKMITQSAAYFDISPSAAEITSTVPSPKGNYPLLEDLNVYRTNAMLVAEYINLVDAASGRI